MRTLLLMTISLLPVHLSANEVVENTNIEIQFDSQHEEFRITTYQDVEGNDPTSIIFVVTEFFVEEETFFITMRFTNLNADEGSDWFLVSTDDAFTETNICNDEFEFWGGIIKGGGGGVLGNEITVPIASFSKKRTLPVYLGVNTGSKFKSIGRRGIFGWIELNIIGPSNIEIVRSAVSYSATGITIGRNFLYGDVNCDGSTNLLDVLPFVDLLDNGQFAESADFNNDGAITFLDIDPFVEAISGN